MITPWREWPSLLSDAAVRLMWPLECLICGLDGLSSPFCPDCRLELLDAAGPACPRCALPIGPHERADDGCSECRDRRLGFDAAIALGPYQGPIRHLCLLLKSERFAWLAPWLAGLLMDARGDQLRALGAGRVVAVPLHWVRRWQRGYNQSEALADGIARRLGLRTARPLRRIAWAPKLAHLNRAERARALRHAFRPRRQVGPIAGRTVLLVDDVLTTGATCGAAARALKAAGAERVVAVVIGRTVAGRS